MAGHFYYAGVDENGVLCVGTVEGDPADCEVAELAEHYSGKVLYFRYGDDTD